MGKNINLKMKRVRETWGEQTQRTEWLNKVHCCRAFMFVMFNCRAESDPNVSKSFFFFPATGTSQD